jgi:DNA ligase-1
VHDLHRAHDASALGLSQDGITGRIHSFYRAERNDDLLKVKTHEDAEARVVQHLPGQGRHTGRMGALLVETREGIRFRLGTGFTDAQRDHPPALGAWVTYRFRGVNESGVPRFASFIRVRPDAPR